MSNESMPDGWTPLESVTVVKALDQNGVVRLMMQCTSGLNTWEALGMCIYAADDFRSALCLHSEEIEEEDE